MTRWLSPDEQRLWRAWIALSMMLPETLSRDLQASHKLTGTDYMVLVVLSEAPQRRVRMSALAEATLLSRSRLSHQIDRMAAAGLVRRLICPEDGRGKYAELTQTGWQRLVAAAPDHVESVRKHVLEQLDPAEFQAWGQACAKIVAGLGGMQGSEELAEDAAASDTAADDSAADDSAADDTAADDTAADDTAADEPSGLDALYEHSQRP